MYNYFLSFSHKQITIPTDSFPKREWISGYGYLFVLLLLPYLLANLTINSDHTGTNQILFC